MAPRRSRDSNQPSNGGIPGWAITLLIVGALIALKVAFRMAARGH